MADPFLSPQQIREIVHDSVEQLGLRAGSRVLGITPDNTRSFDPSVVHEFLHACHAKGAQCDLLIANGTHEHLSDRKVCEFLKLDAVPEAAGRVRIYNHSAPGEEVEELGVLDLATVVELSGGRIQTDIPVTV